MNIKSWKWKILAVILFCACLLIGDGWFNTGLKLDEQLLYLDEHNDAFARLGADIDARDGKLRILDIGLFGPRTNLVSDGAFLGETDGPFQIWYRSKLTSADEFNTGKYRSDSNYCRAYNREMYSLYRIIRKFGSITNQPGYFDFWNDGGKLAEPAPSRRRMPTILDSNSNAYNFKLEIRVPMAVKIDPLCQGYFLYESTNDFAGTWIAWSEQKEVDGFRVIELGYEITKAPRQYGFAVEPGFHPAQIFRLEMPNPINATEWSGWKSPDMIENSNSIFAYRRALAEAPSSTKSAAPFQLRYKIVAWRVGAAGESSHYSPGWAVTVQTVEWTLCGWVIFFLGCAFVSWMDHPGLGWVSRPLGLSGMMKTCGRCPTCGRKLTALKYFLLKAIKPLAQCEGCRTTLRPDAKYMFYLGTPIVIAALIFAFVAREQAIERFVIIPVIGVFVAIIIWLFPRLMRFDVVAPKSADSDRGQRP